MPTKFIVLNTKTEDSKMKCKTLIQVRDAINKINADAGKAVISDAGSYLEYYKRHASLPSQVTEYFSQEEQDNFISHYVSEKGIDQAQVDLWDALLNRPTVTLKYLRNAIKKINDDAGEALINSPDTYLEYYKKSRSLPSK